jgi:hypothetical protein
MMKLIATLASATALAIAMPVFAEPGGNKGSNGRSDHGAHAQGPEKRGGSNDRGKGGGRERASNNDEHGKSDKKGNGVRDNRDRENGGKDSADLRGRSAAPARIDRSMPSLGSKETPTDWREWRKRESDAIARMRGGRDIALADRRFDQRIVEGRGLITGCPPGLAKKSNGCMPPGQAKVRDQLFEWRYRDLDRSNYHYDNGYLYRLSNGRISDYIPLLGGALAVGNRYPVDYFSYAAPAYHAAYYGRDEDYLYRYADGGIFEVNPETQMINAIVGLVTGNDWRIGQQMPLGYDVYNVPQRYRDRYFDSATSSYRYDDGYVYQIDPKTQLIVAAISLLT